MPTSGSKSGNPAKRAKAVSSAADFKKATRGAEIELPSGNVAVIARPGLPALIAEGLLGDTLSSIAQSAVNNGKGLPQQDMAKLADDPEKVAAMLDAFDKVTARCWKSPAVIYYKANAGSIIPEGDRDPHLLYSDEVGLEDKMFTFQFVSGGDADLERFREQLTQSVDGVSAGEGVAGTPVSPL
jgi:hypothetical protein